MKENGPKDPTRKCNMKWQSKGTKEKTKSRTENETIFLARSISEKLEPLKDR